MPKRGRGSESLTGGTGDVNPQFLNMQSSASTTASFATTAFSTPINKFPEASGRVVIMELLKVFIDYGQFATTSVAAGSVKVYLTTKNFDTTQPSQQMADPTVVAFGELGYTSPSAGGTGIIYSPHVLDLTDGAGHGVLVATDNLYLGTVATTLNNPTSGQVQVKLLYRFKKVALAEYIGIVQSQQ